MKILTGLVPWLLMGSAVFAARPDIMVADFEGRDYGKWQMAGTAFGSAPAKGSLPGQMAVTGFLGHGLVNSFQGGDDAKGTLTSPPFKISRKYLNFLIGGGAKPGEACINLLVEGKIVRTATGPNDKPGGTEYLRWAGWDVSEFDGKTVRVEIVDRATGGWGHINVDQITQSDDMKKDTVATTPLYGETYRPQFHFSSQRGWLNDPNGMVFYGGEYHLFFQHNPKGTDWGNMTWGHAVSPDMTHWEQLPHALLPDNQGTMFSGSAVVDENNTAGFQQGKEKTLVALYTAAGGTSPESKGQPFTQGLAYSTDKGRTWTKYAGNPVIKHIEAENRDPKVIWHEGTKSWILALYLDRDDFTLFSSPDLKNWTRLQTLTMPGSNECPDFFEMPVEGTNTKKWVLTGANGRYFVGDFDGKKFTPETPVLQPDYGDGYYAVQTFSDTPDKRRIQIAWMRGGTFPQMPFNQQMSYPAVMTLHNTPDGLRLHRLPVKEITRLYDKKQTSLRDVTVKPGDNPLKNVSGELWDIEAEFEVQDATSFGLRTRGAETRYTVADKTITSLGHTAPLSPMGKRVKLRLLVDRTSLEVFAGDGQVGLTSNFLPRPEEQSLEVFADGGSVKLVSLTAHPLKSAWPANPKAMP